MSMSMLVSCRSEGAADGGIVVQDCLEMMNNLLRGNAKNQLLFRSVTIAMLSDPNLCQSQLLYITAKCIHGLPYHSLMAPVPAMHCVKA